ncbi:hypothetical protein [Luteimonas sp. 100069]|uniref:hypothetical protein n=1 Tax=Luteimonas sp. 100069 TaxID=2006109 RepID=UPI000F4F6FC7|nr:hypothetical protein [Luteimonas sp. 100069]RPD85202.1 hypothetical protein EGK76_09795 [Luteimonas sp. 100069]
MKATVPDALGQLVAAVHELFQIEYLARTSPGEPHVVSELHILMRPRFTRHTVSNEYDRREQEIKRLGTSRIIPDIIVHVPESPDENLLVVEVKLAGNYNYKSDVRKLSGMTEQKGQYAYATGAHLVLNVPKLRVDRGHVYIDGALHPDLTAWFQGQFA